MADVQLGKMLQPAASSVQDNEVPYLRAGHLSQVPDELPRMWATPKDMGQYQVEAGDIVVAEGGDVGRVGFVPQSASGALIQNSLHRVRPKGGRDRRFLAYVLEAVYLGDWLEVLCNKSTFGHLTVEKLKALRVPDPPAVKQSAIADYLDTETARIDALITKKQRMIDLIHERYRTTVTITMSQGLEGTKRDSSTTADTQPIASGWKTAPLSTICSFASGKAHEPFIDDDGPFICVNARFVSTEGRILKRCSQNLVPARPSDILMVMSDLPNGRALARAYFVDGDQPLAVNQRVCRISAHSIDAKFAFYQLDRHPALLRYEDGSNQTHLPNSAFTKLSMVIPPKPEQLAIVRCLDSLASQVDGLSAALRRQIELLSERRHALIIAAVTGELDVPGVAA
jgi:type I restriction enzyme S subunit